MSKEASRSSSSKESPHSKESSKPNSNASKSSNSSLVSIEQSPTEIKDKLKEMNEAEEENIKKLKNIIDNPRQTLFISDCIRKKSNWSKLAKVYKFDNPSFNPAQLLRDIPIVSPKLNKLLNVIEDLDKADMRNYGRLFKHFIFSDLKGIQGAKVITSSLIAKGMTLGYNAPLEFLDISKIKTKTKKNTGGDGSDSGESSGSSSTKSAKSAKSAKSEKSTKSTKSNEEVTNYKYGKIELTPPATLAKKPFNNFYLLSSVGVFDQPISVSKKKEILATFNSRPDNVYGNMARIIVMDSGFKEGIDLFDIKYIHIFEPQTTMADQKQVIGRGTRTCGQKGLVFHPTMGWPLYVFNYDVEINQEYSKFFNNTKSLFDLYLKTLNIDLRLFNFLAELENTIVAGSVDYELNRNIHNFSIVRPNSVNDVNNDSENYSSAKTVSSLDSLFFKGGLNSNIPLHDLPFGNHEKFGDFIKEHFKENSWNDVKMENMCGYAGPDMSKKKLPTRPSFSKNMPYEKPEFEEYPGITEKIGNKLIPLPNPPSKIDKEIDTILESPPKPLSNEEGFFPPKPPSKEDIILPPKPPSFDSQRTVTEEKKVLTPPIIIEPSPEKELSSEKEGSQETPKHLPRDIPDNHYNFNVGMKELSIYSGGAPNQSRIKGGGPTSLMTLSPSQAFVRNYFTPQNPQKGILLNWSVGTGKTCAAIATATSSFESEGYTILWVTRTTLKNDIWKNMFEQVCSDKIRGIIEKEGGVEAIPSDVSKRMKLLSDSWSVRPMSYKQFSNLVSKQNSFYKSLVKKNGVQDPLRKTLLIIDEAHKLYGGNDLSSLERPDMAALHRALMDSYIISGQDSVRVLLMTATPITVNPMELIKLLNLCRPSEKQIPEGFDEFSREFSLTEEGSFSKEGKDRFLDEIAGYISYLNREKDARQFAQPVIKQVKVPLVANNDVKNLIELFDIPIEDQESEEFKNIGKLESEIEKHTQTLNDWNTITTSSKFKPILKKCDGLSPEIKAECKKTISAHIIDIVMEAKREANIVKERIKGIKLELKELTVSKNMKIKEVRKNIKEMGDDYTKYKNTLYSNLKNVCSKNIKDISKLKEATEELPEIVEINQLIERTDESIKQLQIDFKNKIEVFKKQISELREQITGKDISLEEKVVLKNKILAEETRFRREIKAENDNVKKLTDRMNVTKKGYINKKNKLLLTIKKNFKKDISTKKRDLNKTKKLQRKMEDIDIERQTEELNKLISDKKNKVIEDILKFQVRNRQYEAVKQAEDRDKQIIKQQLLEAKMKEKKQKEEEKEKAKEDKLLERQEAQRKKDAEKQELQRKKEAEKQEAQRKKEAK